MSALNLRNSSAAIAATAVLILGTTGCVATRKYARQQVAPVEARTTAVEKKTADHATAINDLENNLSRTDERAMDAERKARAAQDSADAAGRNATEAGNRADQARQLAENANTRVGQVVENLDTYQLVTTQNVLFPVGRSVLTKTAKQTLDDAVAQIQNSKNYVLEVSGFTDRTGSKAQNLVLSQQRADAVVRYLTTQHNIPLRKIHVLGEGIDSANNGRSRAARKEARRVELKVFALNVNGPATQGSQASNMSGMNSGNTTNSGNTMNNGTTGSNMNNSTTGSSMDNTRSRTTTDSNTQQNSTTPSGPTQ